LLCGERLCCNLSVGTASPIRHQRAAQCNNRLALCSCRSIAPAFNNAGRVICEIDGQGTQHGSHIGAKQYAVTHRRCAPPAPFGVIVIELDGRSIHIHGDRDAASGTRNICGHQFLSVFDHMRERKDGQART
jgi:hypothetical protein